MLHSWKVSKQLHTRNHPVAVSLHNTKGQNSSERSLPDRHTMFTCVLQGALVFRACKIRSYIKKKNTHICLILCDPDVTHILAHDQRTESSLFHIRVNDTLPTVVNAAKYLYIQYCENIYEYCLALKMIIWSIYSLNAIFLPYIYTDNILILCMHGLVFCGCGGWLGKATECSP